MSSSNNSNEHNASTLELIGMVAANALIQSAKDCIGEFENLAMPKSLNKTLSILAHALMQQNESHFIEKIEQMRVLNSTIERMHDRMVEIAESADFIASEFEAEAEFKAKRFNILNEREKLAIKETLTKLYLDGLDKQPTEEVYASEMERIRLVSNGWCWNG